MAGVAWWNFYFSLFPGAFKSPQVAEFLRYLMRHLPGKLLAVCGRSQIHRCRPAGEFVARQRGRIAREYLPPYAQELNPVVYIWGYWKYHELPNFSPLDFSQLGYLARRALRRMRRRPSLVMTFWQQSGLLPL